MALRVIALSCVVFLLSLISFAAMATSEEKCTYIVRVMTGDVKDAATDSTISLNLNNSSGKGFTVDNLENWGIMEPGDNYFTQGRLDVFSGTGPCFSVCSITVNSDGTGKYPGWYLDCVEIAVIGCHKRTKAAFSVNQWLFGGDGYHLYATVNLYSGFFVLRPALSSV
ncbi:PLAT domain-containing protein 3-like [Neltuma alba]|uniref:PLAT domain-containing protein 3-like n=1 Tax=Neltuma alba TaxID=207710 RepID=UPI0010A4863D|nr:PLAT domain-containing protein 3-like [Prosopis alba]